MLTFLRRAPALAAAALLLFVPATGLAADSREDGDAQIVKAAWGDWSKNPNSGLAPHIAALQEVLGHAPASYPMIEKRGDTLTVRALTESEGMMLGVLASATGGVPSKLVIDYDTYGNASWLLGWYFNHVREPQNALQALNAGLSLQPDNGALVSEKGMALSLLGRFPDVVDIYEGWLKLGQGGDASPHRARILRAKGYALIELGRLDDAEAAYQASLKIEPDHATAKAELDYIAKVKAGAKGSAGSPAVLTTSDKAKSGQKP